MTLWEFACCVDGWNLAQGHEPEPEPPSYEQHLAMVKQAQDMMGRR